MHPWETQITMVKWTNAGGQTKQANEGSFVYRTPAWRRWQTWKPPCVRLENPDLDFENLNPDFPIVSDHLLSAVTSDELINKRQIKKEELLGYAIVSITASQNNRLYFNELLKIRSGKWYLRDTFPALCTHLLSTFLSRHLASPLLSVWGFSFQWCQRLFSHSWWMSQFVAVFHLEYLCSALKLSSCCGGPFEDKYSQKWLDVSHGIPVKLHWL